MMGAKTRRREEKGQKEKPVKSVLSQKRGGAEKRRERMGLLFKSRHEIPGSGFAGPGMTEVLHASSAFPPRLCASASLRENAFLLLV